MVGDRGLPVALLLALYMRKAYGRYAFEPEVLIHPLKPSKKHP
ncbi:MAG: hypothetical protein VX730_08765 [Pseudomonadota bacterium]|nr:hypothetical protein [Pseudomonadota bacterium]